MNKRALRFITGDNSAAYEDLCRHSGLLDNYRRYIKTTAIIMHKIKNQIAPSYLLNMFTVKESAYGLRNVNSFIIPKFNTVTFGKKSLRYYGPKLWNLLPTEIKESVSLPTFKIKIKKWLKELDNIDNFLFN